MTFKSFFFSVPIIIILAVSSAYADVYVKCFSKGTSAVITGSVGAERARLLIVDPQRNLGVDDRTDLSKPVTFGRYIRKKEAKYSFASFIADASAWEDFIFSLPKPIIEGAASKFIAYFTILTDDGDAMVPGPVQKFTCIAR